MKMTGRKALILIAVLILGVSAPAAIALASAAEGPVPVTDGNSEPVPEEAAESTAVPDETEGEITAKTIRNDYLKRGGIGVAVVVVLYAVLTVLNRKGGKSRRKRTRK